MRLLVKTTTGTTTVIEADPDETVESLKTKVFQKQQIPVESQRLIIHGKQLENGHKLKEYKLAENSVLDLILHIKGGF